MSSTVTSAVTIIQKLSMVSYDVSWTGTSPVGNIYVQVSNTYSQNADGTVRNPGNWTNVALSANPTISTNSGNGFIDIDAIGAYAMRLVYEPVSGTGSLNVTINGKVA
jgi:hypothetical protein